MAVTPLAFLLALARNFSPGLVQTVSKHLCLWSQKSSNFHVEYYGLAVCGLYCAVVCSFHTQSVGRFYCKKDVEFCQMPFLHLPRRILSFTPFLWLVTPIRLFMLSPWICNGILYYRYCNKVFPPKEAMLCFTENTQVHVMNVMWGNIFAYRKST